MSFYSKNKINFNPSTLPLSTTINQIKNKDRNGLDLQPDYQRGFIWTSDFKDKLIFSVSKNYPIGNVIIRNLEKPKANNAKSEVVDGQQRLTTLYQFMNNEYSVSKDVSRKIILENLDYFKEERENKKVYKVLKRYNENKTINLKFEDFPERLVEDFRNYPLSITAISNATTDQVSEYFRFVQNQERLKAGEIIKSIPESELRIFYNKILNKNNFFENISFDNNRKEFDKIFYSIIGVFERKINLGSTDKIIMNYVQKHDSNLSDEASIYTENMINAINCISKISLENPLKFNKRTLKLFLLVSGFNFIDFSINTVNLLKTIEKIDNKLSAFNSAKKDSIKEAMIGYNENEIENYRLIALLVKGSHAYNRVYQRVELFSKIVYNELKK